MPVDDFFIDDDPTIVEPERPTPPQGTLIPDFDAGLALGHRQGIADGITKAMHGLRLALLRAGVPAEEVEPIVTRVRAWIR